MSRRRGGRYQRRFSAHTRSLAVGLAGPRLDRSGAHLDGLDSLDDDTIEEGDETLDAFDREGLHGDGGQLGVRRMFRGVRTMSEEVRRGLRRGGAAASCCDRDFSPTDDCSQAFPTIHHSSSSPCSALPSARPPPAHP